MLYCVFYTCLNEIFTVLYANVKILNQNTILEYHSY